MHSSHIIKLTSCKIFPKDPFLRTEYTLFFCKETVRGSLKVERAVRPPDNRVAAIPDDVMAKASFPLALTFANIKLVTNVLPVPPGASKKRIFPSLTRSLFKTKLNYETYYTLKPSQIRNQF